VITPRPRPDAVHRPLPGPAAMTSAPSCPHPAPRTPHRQNAALTCAAIPAHTARRIPPRRMIPPRFCPQTLPPERAFLPAR
jgi:hypothetical protein